jgi:tetratricopeptide (TPR) repeat protein
MEVTLLGLLFAIYLVLRYYLIDHETASEKDQKRFQEGILLVKDRQIDTAFDYFNEAVQKHPKSAVAYAWRGKCQLLLENHYSAIYDLTEAISRDNTLAECYLDRGIALYRVEQFTEAFREFDKAVWHIRDERPDAYRWRAVARIELRQLAQAENDLRRAVMLGDEDAFQLLRQPPFTRPQPVDSRRK